LTPLEIWISATFTIAILSLMYKENPLYSAAEHIYVGLAAGHFVVMGYNNIVNLAIRPLGKGKLVVVIPIVLGLLLYSRFFNALSWLSRYPMALLTGLGVGMTIRGSISAEFVSQVSAAMMPLNSMNNFLMMLITISVLVFFLFVRTSTHPAVKSISEFGRWAMMVAFGATFGGTVMGAMTLLSGRVQFLLSQIIRL
jgi:hypothetical protein